MKKEIISQDLEILRCLSPHGGGCIYSYLLEKSSLNSNTVFRYNKDSLAL